MKPPRHLTIRVAWHDQQWNGAVCRSPSLNSYCLLLDRIRAERDDQKEDRLQGRNWSELEPGDLPPCQSEGGGFMNAQPWRRLVDHPYRKIAKCAGTHGHLKPTWIKVPEYTTFAVPFRWMLAGNQTGIDNALAAPLPPDEAPRFPTSWVFGRERQMALSEQVFGQLIKNESLVFFYCKEGHPLGDSLSRLIVGVGRIQNISGVHVYDTTDDGETYPLWDRLITHSIRPGKTDGFLLPYHEYARPTGDADEDARRLDLLREIAVEPADARRLDFSYAAEVTSPDGALSGLTRLLDSIRKIRQHGLVDGPWQEREDWLNAQIERCWNDRGAFPGIGPALEALGLRLGTSLCLEMMAAGTLDPEQDPWPAIEAVLEGRTRLPSDAYEADLEEIGRVWAALPVERRGLLRLLSRFDLTPAQARRWFDPAKRARSVRRSVNDGEILANPYRIAELDLGDGQDEPLVVETIDRGVLPDPSVALLHPVPTPSRVETPRDRRRIRAALVTALLAAAREGDALLSETEACQRFEALELTPPADISADWLAGNEAFIGEEISRQALLVEPGRGTRISTLQLIELRTHEARLRQVLQARAAAALTSLGEDWPSLIRAAIEARGGVIDLQNLRHQAALAEQGEALERITTRKLGLLVGRAGTGKTSTLAALLGSAKLAREGILLLAPTGKARVRLGTMARSDDAQTIAQFLYGLKRYDSARQRPLVGTGEKFSGARTVVIDEASMLTTDTLAAVIDAIDPLHVQRILLVGDPNQLPPIGVGRPFADFVAYVESAVAAASGAAQALGKLDVEVRTSAGGPSDTLRLASWFAAGALSPQAERVMSELEGGAAFNDLEVCFWTDANALHERLLEQFQKQLGLTGPSDVRTFNQMLGYSEENRLDRKHPEGVESFQILSPVRMQPHGVREINRWVQRQFRRAEIEEAREPWNVSLGDEEIVVNDKVIQLKNSRRKGWDGKTQAEHFLANGEIGGVTAGAKGYLNVYFAGRAGIGFGYNSRDFPGGSGPLELAYALTVHKAQGSEFGTVFVIVPRANRFLSRELLYTALTRAREKLVLMIEGKSSGVLLDLSRPDRSETGRRNTNLFTPIVRAMRETVPYAENLIHRTDRGHMVRSKSELVIANKLFALSIDYEYERPFPGEIEPGKVYPDFTFADAAGNPVIWEHLGMMDRPDYQRGWDWKKDWYGKNGFELDRNLFVTTETLASGLDSSKIGLVAARIKTLL